MLDSFSQEVELSFHLQQMKQPFVDLHWRVVPLTVIFCWSRVRALAVSLTFMMLSKRMYLFLSGLYCAYMAVAMALAVQAVTLLLANSMS